MKLPVKRHKVVQPQDQSIRLIPLTQGQNAIVDAADFDWLDQWNWFARFDSKGNCFYATRWKGGGNFFHMHREVISAKSPMVDHINGNTLDNRRANLREANSSLNQANRRKMKTNTTGFRGVQHRPDRKDGKVWRARIYFDGSLKSLGYYTTREEAAAAFADKQREIFGEFANPTFHQ